MSKHNSSNGATIVIIILIVLIIVFGIVFALSEFTSIFKPKDDNYVVETTTASTSVASVTPSPTLKLATHVPVITIESPIATDVPEQDTVLYKVEVITGELSVREKADGSSKRLSTVKKGDIIEIYEVDDIWLKIEYNGGYAWISSNFTIKEGEVTPSPEPTTAPSSASIITKMAATSKTSSALTIVVTFNEGVYGDIKMESAIAYSDFEIQAGVFTGSKIEDNTMGTKSITLYIKPHSGATSVKVTSKTKAIYNEDGEYARKYEKLYYIDSTPAAEGAITSANIVITTTSSGVSLGSITHTAGGSSATIKVDYTLASTAGVSVMVTVTAYYASGSTVVKEVTTNLPNPLTQAGELTYNISFSVPVYGIGAAVG